MKRAIFLFAATLMFVSGVTAQKQIGGDKNVEMNFTPLGGNPISINGIKVRLFNSENSAIRIGLYVGSTTDKSVTAQEGELNPSGPTSPILYQTDKTFDFSIRPGYEIHFDGTDRLSPYIGAELLFGMGSMSSEDERWNSNDIDNDGKIDGETWTVTDKDSFTNFGLNALFGFDWYFSDNIYLGAEMGFGFLSTSYGDSEIEISDIGIYNQSNGLDPDTDPPAAVVNGSNFQLGPNVNGAIRLGVLIN